MLLAVNGESIFGNGTFVRVRTGLSDDDKTAPDWHPIMHRTVGRIGYTVGGGVSQRGSATLVKFACDGDKDECIRPWYYRDVCLEAVVDERHAVPFAVRRAAECEAVAVGSTVRVRTDVPDMERSYWSDEQERLVGKFGVVVERAASDVVITFGPGLFNKSRRHYHHHHYYHRFKDVQVQLVAPSSPSDESLHTRIGDMMLFVRVAAEVSSNLAGTKAGGDAAMHAGDMGVVVDGTRTESDVVFANGDHVRYSDAHLTVVHIAHSRYRSALVAAAMQQYNRVA